MSYKPRSLFRLIEEINRSLFLPHIRRKDVALVAESTMDCSGSAGLSAVTKMVGTLPGESDNDVFGRTLEQTNDDEPEHGPGTVTYA